MEKTDAQLVEECLLGEDASFEQIVSRYARPIYGFIFRLTGAKDEVDDIVQNVFFRVWKKLKSYDSSQSFKTWIFSIARNASIDWLRKKKSLTFSNMESDDAGEYFEQTIVDTEPLQDELFEKREAAELLESVLDELSLDYKTVLLLHYLDGLTFQEIAEIIKKPMNTVKSQHRRALMALKGHIEKKLEAGSGTESAPKPEL